MSTYEMAATQQIFAYKKTEFLFHPNSDEASNTVIIAFEKDRMFQKNNFIKELIESKLREEYFLLECSQTADLIFMKITYFLNNKKVEKLMYDMFCGNFVHVYNSYKKNIGNYLKFDETTLRDFISNNKIIILFSSNSLYKMIKANCCMSNLENDKKDTNRRKMKINTYVCRKYVCNGFNDFFEKKVVESTVRLNMFYSLIKDRIFIYYVGNDKNYNKYIKYMLWKEAYFRRSDIKDFHISNSKLNFIDYYNNTNRFGEIFIEGYYYTGMILSKEKIYKLIFELKEDVIEEEIDRLYDKVWIFEYYE